jgi:hypothetical protein
MQLKPKCYVCGRIFKSVKALNTHISKSHPNINPPLIYADEGLEVKHRGCHVELKVRVRRTLWKDLEARAREEQITLEELIFHTLTNLAAFGREYKSYIDVASRKPNYVT